MVQQFAASEKSKFDLFCMSVCMLSLFLRIEVLAALLNFYELSKKRF